jgi:hypothetical protein
MSAGRVEIVLPERRVESLEEWFAAGGWRVARVGGLAGLTVRVEPLLDPAPDRCRVRLRMAVSSDWSAFVAKPRASLLGCLPP